MKLGLSLQGLDNSIKNLEKVNLVINKDFRMDLLEQGNKLRDKAKQILQARSMQRTGMKYWTGKLKDSIKVNVGETISWGFKAGSVNTPEGRNIFSISVGPDMRTAPYAEWIEFGHSTGYGGTKWEGYHYLEGAYTEIGPSIPRQIAKTLSIALNNFAFSAGRIRNKTTGQFVAGSIK